MATSKQITQKILDQPNPLAAEFRAWLGTHYLVAQHPAASDFDETIQGHYKGRMVIPGPKADPTISDKLGIPHLSMRDFQVMKSRYFIRFVDNKTTQDAGDNVAEALYTIMTDSEVKDYEDTLRKLKDERKRVSS